MGAPKKSMPRPTRHQVDLIEQRRASGWDMKKIAADLGLDVGAVRDVITEQDRIVAQRPALHIDFLCKPGQPAHRRSADCWCDPLVAVGTDTTVVRHTGMPRKTVTDSIRREQGYEANRHHVPARIRGSRNEP